MVKRRAKPSQKEVPALLSIGALTVDDGDTLMHVEQDASASVRKGRVAKRGVMKVMRKVKRRLAKRKVAGIGHKHKRKNVNRKK
jgi:signal transduction protein with GAF and PtsI domain